MCGRVVVAMDSETLIRISKAKTMNNSLRHRQSYNMTPGRYIPGVYRNNKNCSNEEKSEELECMKWGIKNKDEIPIINARSENVSVYQIYKNMKRCVIIINGYYEWKTIISQSGEESSQPYYIHNKNEDYLTLGGLYREAADEVNLF